MKKKNYFYIKKTNQMKKLIIFYFILNTFVAFAQDSEKLFNDGYDAAVEGNYLKAIDLYSKAIQIRASYTNAYYNRGWCYQNLGKFSESAKDFSKVIELDPTYQAAYVFRGYGRYSLGFLDEALSDYYKAIEMDSKDKTAYNNIGEVMEKMQNYKEAMKYYEKALALDPSYHSAKNNKAELKEIMANTVNIKKEMTAKDYYESGYTFSQKEKFDSAIICFDNALKLDRNDRQSYNQRGFAYTKLDKYHEAIADLEQALNMAPDKWSFNQRGWARFKVGMLEEAVADFDKALSIDPEYTTALENKKWVLKSLSEQKVIDKTPPIIIILSPQMSRGLDVTRMDESVTILGRATDEHGVEQVIINGNTANLKANGEFDATIKLANGKNQIIIVAFDFNGNKKEEKFTIERTKPSNATNEKIALGGKNYALLFAIDQYDEWTALNNPVNDAKTISEEVKQSYGFETEVVSNANRAQILSKLREYAQKTYEPNDQLLIMFAGHGHFDEIFGEGYVVAKDSKKDDEGLGSYISHSQLRTYLNNIKSKHIFLMMDVCFGGTFDPLIAKRGGEEGYGMLSKVEFANRKLRFKTRRYLTSGGKEYVSDGQAGKHSPFARKFLEALRTYGGQDGILTIQEILSYVESLNPEPRTGEFGDNEPGSDFIFIAK